MKNNVHLHQRLLVLSLCCYMFLSGCASFFAGDDKEESEFTKYTLNFHARPKINNGSPLKVRVLQLKSDAEFMSSDFYSLQKNALPILGANLLSADDFFIVTDNLSKTLSEKRFPETRYIGVIAEYQSINGKKWRTSLPVPKPEEIPFWKVWKSTEDELQLSVELSEIGIQVVQQ